MKYAILNNNNEVELVENEMKDLATKDELEIAICCGYIEVEQHTMVKEGIMIWHQGEYKSEMDFVEFSK